MRAFIAALAILPVAVVAPPSFANETMGAPAPDKLICKVKARTGTRFATRTCRTQAEWERLSTQHQRDASEMIDRPVQNRDCGQSSVGNPATGEAASGC